MSKRRLGKGIDALLQGRPLDQLQQMASILMVNVDDVSPNPKQPRKRFNDASLAELADSIREKGIIQPILAEDRGDGTYVIVAGERRYRAAKLAGLTEVPIISRDLTDEEMLEVALIENIQREDLNPIDEARALQSALDQSGLTQEQLAKRLGKSRPAVANALRLLRLDDDMQAALSEGGITAGHARALLALDDEADRRRLFERLTAEGLSVREAEVLVKGGRYDEGALDRLRAAAAGASGGEGDRTTDGAASGAGASLDIAVEDDDELELPGAAAPGKSAGRPTEPRKSVQLRAIEEALVEHFGTRVIVHGSENTGKIEIPYYSSEDLERVLQSMGARLPE